MPSLSRRSIIYRKTPIFKELYPYVDQDVYDAKNNPDGIISVAVANNILMGDLLTKQIKSINERNDVTESDLDYTDNHGSPAFRSVIANLFQKYIFKVDDKVDPDNIIIINGACAVVEQVVAATCDAGDCVMIPSPLYHSFEVDVNGRNECEIVPVPMTNDMKLDFDTMDAVYEASRSKGKQIKMFLLCHPNNPTGTVYPKEDIDRLIEWTRERDMHLVSDEVYALSVYSKSPVKFYSAGHFMFSDRDVQHVHIIYGLSKDFMLNGLRVGMLYTQNRDLYATLRCAAAFHSISTHTQVLLTHLLGNDEFVRQFLNTSQSRLTNCYEQVKNILDRYNIEYYDPQAGQFFWINLAPLIKKKYNINVVTKEDELQVWRKLVHDAKVFLHAGQFFKWEEPGWFRMCFTCRTIPVIEELVKRIVRWSEESTREAIPAIETC